MYLLAIETASEAAGVALSDDGVVVAQATLARGRRHGETVAPAVDFVCRAAGVAPAAVDVLAVDVGPGLFTGLRVGVATTTMLAAALGRPVVALTSLEVLATWAFGADPSLASVVPVVDARRGEVFWARYGRPRHGDAPFDPVLHGTEQVGRAATLAAELGLSAPAGTRLLGDGARRYAEELSVVPGVAVDLAAPAFPPVEALAAAATHRALAGRFSAPAEVVPRYLRGADVRINWEQRAPRSATPAPAAGP